MRAVTSDIDTGTPAEGFLRVLDQFAALRSFSGDASAVGGYRVLTPKRAAKRTTHRALAQALAVAARERARIRWTGSLSVLFIGGLGLAVLAGPASCPCSSAVSVAEQTSLNRLGYVQVAHLVTEREFAVTRDTQLPSLSSAAVIEPEESAEGVSPITTSALEPAREVSAVNSDDLPAASAGPLPVIEQVADAVPEPVKLAAAPSVESDVPPTLPAIEVATPPTNDVTASELEREPATKSRSLRKRIPARAYRTPNQQVRLKAKKSGAPQVAQSPKWAQQMFVTPWQTKAFSYMQ